MTMWKWATTKYVSWRLISTTEFPKNKPVNPPDIKNETSPIENNMAGVNTILPLHSVAM